MNVEPYLSFPGTCEEALKFYQSIFAARSARSCASRDAPAHGQDAPVAPNAVMHTSFRAPGLAFMASDAMRDRLAETGDKARRLAC